VKNYFELFFSVIQKFESQNLPYMVVGSIASMVYGEPRLTHDLDLVIDILPADASKLEALFPSDEFYCPPPEVIRSELVHRGQFNLIHPESGLKVDVIIRKNTKHAIQEFKRRKKIPFWQGSEVYIASPEDIILKKLDYYREGGSEKHLKDIRGILVETKVDQQYLDEWIEELTLNKEWKQV
jgi:hypothetical protein